MKIKFQFSKHSQIDSKLQFMLIKAYLDRVNNMLSKNNEASREFFELRQLSIYFYHFQYQNEKGIFTFHHFSYPSLFTSQAISCKGKINDSGISLINTLEKCEHNANHDECENSRQCFTAIPDDFEQAKLTYEVTLEENTNLHSNLHAPYSFVIKSITTPIMQRFDRVTENEVARLIKKNSADKALELRAAKEHTLLMAANSLEMLTISFSGLYHYHDGLHKSVRQVALQQDYPMIDQVTQPLKQAKKNVVQQFFPFWENPSTAELMFGARTSREKMNSTHKTKTDKHFNLVQNEIENEEASREYFRQTYGRGMGGNQ